MSFKTEAEKLADYRAWRAQRPTQPGTTIALGVAQFDNVATCGSKVFEARARAFNEGLLAALGGRGRKRRLTVFWDGPGGTSYAEPLRCEPGVMALQVYLEGVTFPLSVTVTFPPEQANAVCAALVAHELPPPTIATVTRRHPDPRTPAGASTNGENP